MEHCDGSGARSYVNIPPSSNLTYGNRIDNTEPRTLYEVDCIFPKDNSQDTAPHNAKGVDTELRNAQIEMRMAEIEEAFSVLSLMNSGQGILQTDFTLLYPTWMSWLGKTLVNAKRAIYLAINSSLKSRKRTLPEDQTVVNLWLVEDILDTTPLVTHSSVPADYRPHDRWITARLKVPNELRLRVMNWLCGAPKSAPTDANGKPLVAVITRALGDEVWMHISPSKNDTRRRNDHISGRIARNGSTLSSSVKRFLVYP
ncbi:Platelet-activating factor acetylhydrolase [Apiospora phragmitis]|uniref:Platelet-activating factor acetylhydrolase n=1 Tax=Apiospora phragmitis TaxID=2905665 RepID=A0ABR1UL43_9PEZI